MRLRTEWQRWRARQVTELLREIRRVQKEESPNMSLSAAVVPSVRRAHDIYGQDWGMWINKGLLDIVVTMSYSHDREVVLAQARAARKVVRNGLLYVGVAVYNQSLDSAVKCVRELRKLDVDGFSVFSYNSMLEHPEGFKTFRKTVLEVPSSTSRTR